MSKDERISREMHFRDLIPRLFNRAILRIGSSSNMSKMRNSFRISVFVLQNVESFFPLQSQGLQFILCSETRARIVLMQDFLYFQRKLLTVHSVLVDFQNVSSMCQMSSVYQAADKNHGEAFHGDSQADRERDNPELLAVSKSENSLEPCRAFILSCKS